MHSKRSLKSIISNKSIHFLAFVAVVLVCSVVSPGEACTGLKTKTKIHLENNGYKNILIGIEAGVRENSALIDRIKTTFTEASALLFNVTK
jgi:hypothetical protein